MDKDGDPPNSPPMDWSNAHDIVLCREILVVDPFQAKKKTIQRAQFWQTIADNLKVVDSPKFKKGLTKRSVQDRCQLICNKYKQKMRKEKAASGISPEHTELDDLIEEIIEKEELSEEMRKDEGEAKKKKIEGDKIQAIEIRKKAMESIGDTSKRQLKEDGGTHEPEGKVAKRRRSGGSETIQFLKEKNEKEMKMREIELDVQREMQENDRKKCDAMMQMLMLQQQQDQQRQQQQQQMQQQFQLMMTQQTNLMMSLFEKINKS